MKDLCQKRTSKCVVTLRLYGFSKIPDIYAVHITWNSTGNTVTAHIDHSYDKAKEFFNKIIEEYK